jgi:hypothetical protein
MRLMQRIWRIAPGALIPPLQDQKAMFFEARVEGFAAGSNPPDSLHQPHPYVL